MGSHSKLSSPGSLNSRPSPLPRIGTGRDWGRPTRGGQVARVAAALGTPLMPWQQHVADVAGEFDSETGLPVYRDVTLLVPRQSGKTTLLLAEMVHRAFAFGRPQNTRYAAQTGDDAISKWKEHVETLQATPFRRVFETNDVNGQRALVWANRSRYTPTATTKKSGHGKTLDQGVIDEAWAQIDFRTEQAMRPAMITRRDAQLFVVSTAGDLSSIFLNSKIDANRERLELEPDAPSRSAYFEWSFADDEDPFSEETWWARMPALGRTIHAADVHAEREDMEERQFLRAYGNVTDKGAAGEQIIDVGDWAATGDDRSNIIGTRAFALDVSNDRAWAAVGWSGKNEDGLDHFELIKHERGTHWVVPYLRDKLARNRADTVAVAGGSQAALMQDDLEAAGLAVLVLSRADYAAACAKTYDGIVDRTVRHLSTGQVPLDIAVAGAAWGAGDARTWSRSKSTTDICPLVAVTVAVWAYALARANDYDVLDSIA